MSPAFWMTSTLKERKMTVVKEVEIDILLSPGGFLAGPSLSKPSYESLIYESVTFLIELRKKIMPWKYPFLNWFCC